MSKRRLDEYFDKHTKLATFRQISAQLNLQPNPNDPGRFEGTCPKGDHLFVYEIKDDPEYGRKDVHYFFCTQCDYFSGFSYREYVAAKNFDPEQHKEQLAFAEANIYREETI